jgi:predicted small secreted protein
MKRKCFILLPLFFLLASFTLMADTNTVLDAIYGKDSAPLKESVWLILAGAEAISSESDLSAAEPYLKEKNWTAGSTLTTGQLAVLLMDNFDLPQGVMYQLTGAPRYALKNLVYYGLINSGSNTEQIVSGYELG